MFLADTMLRVKVFWAKSLPSRSRKGTMKSTAGSEDCGTMLSQPLFEGTLFDENWIRKCPFDSKVALSVSLWEGTLSFWTKVALLQPLCKGHFQRERALSQAKGTFVKESIVELALGVRIIEKGSNKGKVYARNVPFVDMEWVFYTYGLVPNVCLQYISPRSPTFSILTLSILLCIN